MFSPSLDEGIVSTTNTSYFESSMGFDSRGTRFTIIASAGSESRLVVVFCAVAVAATMSAEATSIIFLKFIDVISLL